MTEAAPPAKDNDTDIAAPGDAALKQHTEPPARPTGSNLAGHAWDDRTSGHQQAWTLDESDYGDAGSVHP